MVLGLNELCCCLPHFNTCIYQVQKVVVKNDGFVINKKSHCTQCKCLETVEMFNSFFFISSIYKSFSYIAHFMTKIIHRQRSHQYIVLARFKTKTILSFHSLISVSEVPCKSYISKIKQNCERTTESKRKRCFDTPSTTTCLNSY